MMDSSKETLSSSDNRTDAHRDSQELMHIWTCTGSILMGTNINRGLWTQIPPIIMKLSAVDTCLQEKNLVFFFFNGRVSLDILARLQARPYVLQQVANTKQTPGLVCFIDFFLVSKCFIVTFLFVLLIFCLFIHLVFCFMCIVCVFFFIHLFLFVWL